MAVIYLRSTKGSPLSIAEADANINNLNSELGGKLDISSYTATDVLSKILSVDGEDSGLDADFVRGKSISSTNTPNTLVVRDSSGNFTASTVTANLVGNVTGNITGNGIGTWTGTASNVSGVITVEHGGTGVTTIDDIKTVLSLGSMSSQNSASVNITGGNISGINPLSISSGGTGANSANIARINLGLNIGTDVQGFNPILSSISALSTNGVIVKTGSGSVSSAKLVAGNNISVTNPDFTSGDSTISLVNSPALTGTPTAPTASAGTNTTQIANTAFVKSAVDTGDAAQQVYTDNKFNSITGISAAWVIFDGNTGSILSSKNISSVTSNGAGQYTININSGIFTNGNFIAFGMASGGTNGRYVTFVNSSSTALVVYTVAPNALSYGSAPILNNGVVRIAMFN